MFGIKKTKKEVNGKNTYAVSFIGEDKMLGTDRDILTLRINSQIINFMNAYDHIDYYFAGMPAKNNPNPAPHDASASIQKQTASESIIT